MLTHQAERFAPSRFIAETILESLLREVIKTVHHQQQIARALV
jgi:hypothetical protein